MSNRRKLRKPIPTTFTTRHDHDGPRPRWNGQPCQAVKVKLRITAPPEGMFPQWWAQHLIGELREAVRVTYNGQTFYLDNADGSGWAKVTDGGGSPGWPHRELCGLEAFSLTRPPDSR